MNKAVDKQIPIIYEIRNFGASRIIPTHRGGFNITRNSSIYVHPNELDKKLLDEISSAPFVEVSEKKDLTGYTVRMLRALAKKSRKKVRSRMKKSELLQLVGGIQC